MSVPLAAATICHGPLLWQTPERLSWLLLAAPLLEEWVLRAGLQELLLRRAALHMQGRPAQSLSSAWPSNCLAALGFAALHLGRGLDTALLVLPLGLACSLLYQRTRSWLACAGLHALANAICWQFCQPLN